MKTIKEEINAIATIMNKNLTAIIIELHNLGFDFNKLISEQDGDIDEKVSQMLLSSLMTNVPATLPIEQELETIQEEPVIQQHKLDVIIEETLKHSEMDSVSHTILTKKLQFIKNKMIEAKTKIDLLPRNLNVEYDEDFEEKVDDITSEIDNIIHADYRLLVEYGYRTSITNSFNIFSNVYEFLTENKDYKFYDVCEFLIDFESDSKRKRLELCQETHQNIKDIMNKSVGLSEKEIAKNITDETIKYVNEMAIIMDKDFDSDNLKKINNRIAKDRKTLLSTDYKTNENYEAIIDKKTMEFIAEVQNKIY